VGCEARKATGNRQPAMGNGQRRRITEGETDGRASGGWRGRGRGRGTKKNKRTQDDDEGREVNGERKGQEWEGQEMREREVRRGARRQEARDAVRPRSRVIELLLTRTLTPACYDFGKGAEGKERNTNVH
jgi:hypothetical protein